MVDELLEPEKNGLIARTDWFLFPSYVNYYDIVWSIVILNPITVWNCLILLSVLERTSLSFF